MPEKVRSPDAAKPYVQFSKRVVTTVTAAVTLICVTALILCAATGYTAGLVDVVKAYIGYAIVVFTAYSGNSAVEKWLVNRYGNNKTE